jgi:exosortase A
VQAVRTAVGTPWPFAAALASSALFWLLAWYWDTADTMVRIWRASDTFAHGFVIVPISAWLVWRRRKALAAIAPRPEFRVLPLVALAGLGWLLAQTAGVDVAQQYAFALMIPLLAWAILGTPVARALAFPLGFLLFAVPFGEFLEAPLMDHTADFTVLALRLSGIPVYREGLFFSIPSGNWSVVEACSGLRYLIASVTLGVLYAYLTYRSLKRRLLFIAVSAVVPIVANWLRAYLIVMIGHLSGMRYAVGVDHLIYGWLFFGIVVMILFWIGSFWREDLDTADAKAPSTPPEREGGGVASPRLAGAAAAAAVSAALVAIWPEAAELIEARVPRAPLLLRPPQPAAGWQPVSDRPAAWHPRFQQPRAELAGTFVRNGAQAGFFVAYYRRQGPGAELISSQNVLVASDNAVWKNTGEVRRALVLKTTEVPIIEAKLRSPTTRLLVWRSYWVAGRYVGDPYRAKLLQAKSKLFGGGDDGAAVIVYAPYGERPQAAEQTLRDFMEAMLPAITRSLQDAGRV